MESARRHPGEASVEQQNLVTHKTLTHGDHKREDVSRERRRHTRKGWTVFQQVSIQVQANVSLQKLRESFQNLVTREGDQ
jgi:hypothetical protein